MAKRKAVEAPSSDKTADELKRDIEAIASGKPEPEETPEPAEGESETPAPAEPEPEDKPDVVERPDVDPNTGLGLLYPEPEEKTEPEESPEGKPEPAETGEATPPPDIPDDLRERFKSVDDFWKSYRHMESAFTQERQQASAREAEKQALADRLARLEGAFQERDKQATAEATQPTEEQIAELAQSDPAAYARWLAQVAEARANERVSKLEEQISLERNQRMIQERQDYALKQIPEIRAVHEAKGDTSKMDPDHLEFARRYTTVLDKYPDMTSTTDKMDLAANAVRMQMLREQTEKRKATAQPGAAKPKPRGAKPKSGDVFLESASGRTAATGSLDLKRANAAEIRKRLKEEGIPTVERG